MEKKLGRKRTNVKEKKVMVWGYVKQKNHNRAKKLIDKILKELDDSVPNLAN